MAVLTGYAATGGGFNNYLGALGSRGLIGDDSEKLGYHEGQNPSAWFVGAASVGIVSTAYNR